MKKQKRAKKTVRARAPKPLTTAEEMQALKNEILSMRYLVSAGGKSDIDTVGAKLDEFAAKLQHIIERK